MPRYIVTVREVHTQMVQVDAADAVAAVEAVRDGGGEYLDNTLEYSHTLDPDTWTLEKIEAPQRDPGPRLERPQPPRAMCLRFGG